MEASQAQWHFFGLGMQYYAIARYGALAGFVPVCGNLFHHAIEMFLKGGLSQTHTLTKLRHLGKTGHELPPLWSAFKTEFSNASAALEQFDKTIATLDWFEGIRYPDTIIGEKIRFIDGPSVPDIDYLVAKIFEVCAVDPRFYVGSLNVYAHDAIAKNNPACDWLEAHNR